MFRDLTGFEHCLAVVNGTSAIHLALRTLGVGAGDKVLASSLTFIGSVSPIVFQNADIVFIDSDPVTWNLDPNLLEDELKRMKADNDLPKAVLPTELYGQACDLDRIVEICDRFEVPVVCDSAESLGRLTRIVLLVVELVQQHFHSMETKSLPLQVVEC